MIRFLKHTARKELKGFLLFLATAVLGASVNFLTQIPLKPWFINSGISNTNAYAWSIFGAYIIATVVSFVPSKIYAFSAKSSGNTQREWMKFFLIALLGLGVQTLISVWFLHKIANPFFGEQTLFLREKASHLVGMGCSFIANFLGHRFFTFRTTGIYNLLRPIK